MTKIYKNRYTKKNIKGNSASFQQEITCKFLEMLIMVKLYHWKTYSYATHKATDGLYDKLNEHIDHFVEVLLGKTEKRTNLLKQSKISLIDLNTPAQLKNQIENFKSFLVGLTNNAFIMKMSNTDLLNIRDEILGDLNQFLYLLTFN
jgi:DNA-binding ferritin-like protein